ncbi:MAG: hypothetical protein KTR31_28710 [Myxococcales bacterium]|nr:hypothetical protein [Myxococcales bacterium]
MSIARGSIALALAGCTPSLQDVVERAVADGFEGVIHVEHRGEVLVYDAWGDAIEACPPPVPT